MQATGKSVSIRRAAEIRRLNALSQTQLIERARPQLRAVADIDELHLHFAESIAAVVRRGAEAGRHLALILPWGPVGQYGVLGEILSQEGLSLGDSTLFFMDEYADSSGAAVPPSHPLSFRGAAMDWLGSLEPRLRPQLGNVLFPDGTNLEEIDRRMAQVGGVDTCFGGVGIHGHIAFNEPEPGVSESVTRRVALNEVTRTINAIRAGVGGDLENFPHEAWTLGMRQCLSARRVRLYCRSDLGLDWAKTVLRLAALGSPGDDYPVTWARQHPDYKVTTTRENLDAPAVPLP